MGDESEGGWRVGRWVESGKVGKLEGAKGGEAEVEGGRQWSKAEGRRVESRYDGGRWSVSAIQFSVFQHFTAAANAVKVWGYGRHEGMGDGKGVRSETHRGQAVQRELLHPNTFANHWRERLVLNRIKPKKILSKV